MKISASSVWPPREERIWRGHLVPRKFDAFFVCFHQDFSVVYASMDAAIDEYAGGLKKLDREVVSEFLLTILDGRYDKTELATIWPQTDVKFADPKKVVRPILEAILNAVQPKP